MVSEVRSMVALYGEAWIRGGFLVQTTQVHSLWEDSLNYVYLAVADAKSLQSCPSLGDLMDSSLPSSSVHGILQARILEWVAMPSSRIYIYPYNL